MSSPASPPRPPMPVPAPTEDDACRYCFEGREEGELVAPCNCRGDQTWVHLSCLRRWQRMVLVSQPTHPAFYRDDPRQHRCNVCTAKFTCKPPTRHELMASFTGAEIAAMLAPRSMIGAHEVFSTELETQLESMPPILRFRASSYMHWIRSAYLITDVTESEGINAPIEVPIPDGETKEALLSRLDGGIEITLQGRRMRVVPSGSLEGVADETDALVTALKALQPPATIGLSAEDDDDDCGRDHICAVNLCRRLDDAPDESFVRRQVEAAVAGRGRGRGRASCRDVKLEHYVGGPCDDDEIVSCLVLGGRGCGWTIVKNGSDTLCDAIRLANSRATRRREGQGEGIISGQAVKLHSLRMRQDLNGKMGLALRFSGERWRVRLGDGSGVKIKVANLEPLPVGAAPGRVLCFWGDARWSRTQLLGEIARGHWGLGRAAVTDLTAGHGERWAGLDGRLVFAQESAMTEDFMRQQQREMNRVRAGAVAVVAAAAAEEEEG